MKEVIKAARAAQGAVCVFDQGDEKGVRVVIEGDATRLAMAVAQALLRDNAFNLLHLQADELLQVLIKKAKEEGRV